MLEFYYTLVMLVLFTGMILYSKSIPVALLSLYITYWFLPQGINISGTNIGFLSLLGMAEMVYFLYFYLTVLKENNDKNFVHKTIGYVLGIYTFYLLIAFLSTEMPFESQINDLKYFAYYSFNILIAASCLNKKRDFVCIFRFIVLLIIVSGIYGVYTYIIQFNPFAELVIATNAIFEEQGMGSHYLAEERGFIHGRISGLTVHPLLYGGVLVLCFFFLVSYWGEIKNKIEKIFMLFVFLFCILLIVLTGSRSILIGLLCGLFYYFFKMYPQKVIRYAILGLLLFLAFGLTIEDEYIRSILFFWEDHDEIGGSSKSMRLDQIMAALDIISDDFQSLLFGFGRGWSVQYTSKYGNVPPFQGFEGLFIFSFVEFGILGTFLYLMAVFAPLNRFNSNYVNDSQKKTLNMAFLLSGFIIYAFTGHAYGQWLYIVLIFLMIRYSSCLEKEMLHDSESTYYNKS